MFLEECDVIPPQQRWFTVDKFLPPDGHIVSCIWHYFDTYSNQWIQYQANGVYTDSGWAQASDSHLWHPEAKVIRWKRL